jgi:hypothetical protein
MKKAIMSITFLFILGVLNLNVILGCNHEYLQFRKMAQSVDGSNEDFNDPNDVIEPPVIDETCVPGKRIAIYVLDENQEELTNFQVTPFSEERCGYEPGTLSAHDNYAYESASSEKGVT